MIFRSTIYRIFEAPAAHQLAPTLHADDELGEVVVACGHELVAFAPRAACVGLRKTKASRTAMRAARFFAACGPSVDQSTLAMERTTPQISP